MLPAPGVFSYVHQRQQAMSWRAPQNLLMPSIDSVIETHQYNALPHHNSFRVAEILPGKGYDQVRCRLRNADLTDCPQYEAISSVWGSPLNRAEIFCDGQKLFITRNIYTALRQFRYTDKSRMLWADALCINQADTVERSIQLEQMRAIHEKAQKVLVWLGTDIQDGFAASATAAINHASEILAARLDSDESSQSSDEDDTRHETLLRNCGKLPSPDAIGLDVSKALDSLMYFYSYDNFTQLWAIQEITANERIEVCAGIHSIAWDRIDLVACYLILQGTVSARHNFSKTKCWHVATFAEMARSGKNWLNILYLASNYACMDESDRIYGVRSLMTSSDSMCSIQPDYDLTALEVYRDVVERAFQNFGNCDVLYYVMGNEMPSWIPRWDEPMLFRNPFRFGKQVPWAPSTEMTAKWSIDKTANTLTLSGYIVDEVEIAETYNQRWFAESSMDSATDQLNVTNSWLRILDALSESPQSSPLSRSSLTQLAVSLSFGLNSKLATSDEADLLLQLIAYVVLVFKDSKASLNKHIPQDLLEESSEADGKAFGKPVWDFSYPDAGIFVTKRRLLGCVIAPIQPGDIVFVPHGSSYPLVLRPIHNAEEKAKYTIRGFSYTYGVMHGELSSSETTQVTIC